MINDSINTDTSPETPDCKIITQRVLPYNQQLVFRAWSDLEILKYWWGPKGFTNTFLEFDFRVGGRWRFIMHGPEKGNYNNECEFVKILAPSEIVWKRFTKPLFNVAATFEEISVHETKVVFKQIFNTAEECMKLRPYVMDKNEENFDRLEMELAKMM